jgi:hypothetical protein
VKKVDEGPYRNTVEGMIKKQDGVYMSTIQSMQVQIPGAVTEKSPLLSPLASPVDPR